MLDLLISCSWSDLPNNSMKHCFKTGLKCNLTGHQTALTGLNPPDLFVQDKDMQFICMLDQFAGSLTGEALPGQS